MVSAATLKRFVSVFFLDLFVGLDDAAFTASKIGSLKVSNLSAASLSCFLWLGSEIWLAR